jgi:hypothetical protein
MTSEIFTVETNAPEPVESERGLMLAVLVMVLLGVAGMFLISA